MRFWRHVGAAGILFGCLVGPFQAGGQEYRIQTLGDSITMGVNGYQSYRYRLWKKLVDAGIETDFVGSLTYNLDGFPLYPDYAGLSFDRDHEGHAGWRAEDLLDGCTEADKCKTKNEGYLDLWLSLYTPDFVLLHIGTNDILQRAPPSTTLASINTMIATLRNANPTVVILLAQIIPMEGASRDVQVRYLNGEIAGIAAASTTIQSPVYLVDQYTGFSNVAHTHDGTHPNAAGEELMAQRWFDALVIALLNRNEPPTVDAGRDRWATQFRDEVILAGTTADDGLPTPPGSLVHLWNQLSGPLARIDGPWSPVTSVDLPVVGDYQFQLNAWDGALLTDDSMVVHMQPYSCPRLYFEEAGSVVIEAERTRSRSQGLDAFAFTYWDNAVDVPGYEGSAAMAAYPTGTNFANAKDELIGCHMDYWVEFDTPGTYYAWVRMLGPSDSANSVHLGIGGVPATLGLRGMEEASGFWKWVGTANNQRVSVQVPEPGRFTIDIWMREDGTYVDRILLHRNPAYTPLGGGPEASPSTQVCDFDQDQMDDNWEIERWGSLDVEGSGNLDGDAYLNQEEYVAGTDPEDPESFPVILDVIGSGGEGIRFLSAIDRTYQLEYRDPASGIDEWLPIGNEVPGTGGLLILQDPSPTPTRAYRFRVRAEDL